jgi:methyl-accepting chemotaxis protein
VLLQAIVLLAIYLTMRKTSARLESLAEQVQTNVMPVVRETSALLSSSRGKIEEVVSDIASTTSMVRGQMERIDATLSDVIDRARLQVIRADEVVGRTLDRVDEVSEAVHHKVISPVRQLSGIVSGLTVGFDALFRRGRRRGNGTGVPEDELFV